MSAVTTNIISVNKFDTVDVKEDQKTEFKTSIFIDAETNAPGVKQMMKIARTLAAFMNADGGMLYVGVSDDKQIRGIADDLAILKNTPESVALHNSHYNDVGFTYGETEDKYELKIRAIAHAFLSQNAGVCIKSVVVKPMGGKLVCRVEIIPCAADDFVYFYGKNKITHTEEEYIYIRSGNQNRFLLGEERDIFVRKRANARFDAQLKAVRDAVSLAGTGTHGADAVLASVQELLSKLDGQHISGAAITMSGGHHFTEEAVTAAKKPKSLAWDGQHYAEVSGWQDLILKVFEKLQEINPVKFDELAEKQEFRRNLITIQRPKEKHSDCYTQKFGAKGKIRIKKSLGNKVNLWQEDKAVRKIIAAFGVDVSKFMFVAE